MAAPLSFMVLDVDTFTDRTECIIYGATDNGASVAVIVEGVQPHFWFPAPVNLGTAAAAVEEPEAEAAAAVLSALKSSPVGPHVVDVTVATKLPLVYYRPRATRPAAHFRVQVTAPSAVRKVATQLTQLATSKSVGPYVWVSEPEPLEHSVKYDIRLLVDLDLSSGTWVEVPASCVVAGPRVTRCHLEMRCTAAQLTSHRPPLDSPSTASDSWSRIAPVRQLMLRTAMHSASGTCVPERDPLVVIANAIVFDAGVRHVVFTTAAELPPVLRCGFGALDLRTFTSEADMLQAWQAFVVDVVDPDAFGGFDVVGCDLRRLQVRFQACRLPGPFLSRRVASLGTSAASQTSQPQAQPPAVAWTCPVCTLENGSSSATCEACEASRPAVIVSTAKPLGVSCSTCTYFNAFTATECDMCGCKLVIGNPGLASTGEQRPAAITGTGPAMVVKQLVTYGKDWVRQQRRMTASSNQASFQTVGLCGRLVLDILRVLLTTQSLSEFSLETAVSAFLKQSKQHVTQQALDALWADGKSRYRVIAMCVEDNMWSLRLMEHMQVLPSMLELARVTGLTVPSVMYRGQMLRTWRMLLGAAKDAGYVVGGVKIAANLENGPFLYHPIEKRTTGMYRHPVAILDFASLYPSIFMAYNLCYTTLLHPDDAARMPVGDVFRSVTGAVFVKPHVRAGLIPTLLNRLVSTRAAVKARMSTAAGPLLAVLTARQQALKVCANAMYGFTGAPSSPMVCGPLAESCIFTGQKIVESCRQFIDANGPRVLGRPAGTVRVIYGQTDSLMVLLPDVPVVDAIQGGRALAQAVTGHVGAPPIRMVMERIMCPFLLLHVNRYAGMQFTEADIPLLQPGFVPDDSRLVIKGLESERRGAAPFVRRCIVAVLKRLMVEGDIAAAVATVQHSIYQLLSGHLFLADFVLSAALWREDGADVRRRAAALPGRSSASATDRKHDGSDDEDGDGDGDGDDGDGDVEVGDDDDAGGGDDDTTGMDVTTSGRKRKAGGAAVAAPSNSATTAHVALAARLQARNPDRQFLLGERIPYVILETDTKSTQAEAAEDPATALTSGRNVNVVTYLTNKLTIPLTRILETVLTPAQLKEVFHGPHTRVKITPRSGGMSAPAVPRGIGKFFGAASATSSPEQRSTSCPGCLIGRARPPHAVCETCQDNCASQRTCMLMMVRLRAMQKIWWLAHSSALNLQADASHCEPLQNDNWMSHRLQSQWTIADMVQKLAPFDAHPPDRVPNVAVATSLPPLTMQHTGSAIIIRVGARR